MIDKELIELQRNCEATCVVIPNESINELENKMVINAKTVSDSWVEELRAREQELKYLVVQDIDDIDKNMQEKYYHLVKDREIKKYTLPKDIIIVVTVDGKETIKNISDELYHFCTVAF